LCISSLLFSIIAIIFCNNKSKIIIYFKFISITLLFCRKSSYIQKRMWNIYSFYVLQYQDAHGIIKKYKYVTGSALLLILTACRTNIHISDYQILAKDRLYNYHHHHDPWAEGPNLSNEHFTTCFHFRVSVFLLLLSCLLNEQQALRFQRTFYNLSPFPN